MEKYLTFHINAPMASWGTSSQGVNKGYTNCYPTKSAIHGLLCSCLGIKREQLKERNIIISFINNMIIFCLEKGQLMKDYQVFHVTSLDQLKPTSTLIHSNINNYRKTGIYSRKMYLEHIKEKKGLSSMLRDNYFYINQKHIVVLEIDHSISFIEIENLVNKMKKPIFTPYLGRKTCIPETPLNPILHDNFNDVMKYVNQYSDNEKCDMYDIYMDTNMDVLLNNYIEPKNIISTFERDVPCENFGFYKERNVFLWKNVNINKIEGVS